MHHHSLCSALLTLAFSAAFPLSLHAQGLTQTDEPQAQTQTSTEAAPADAAPAALSLDDALNATPPERRKAAQMLANSPDAAAQIDAWIQNTEVDNPQNLILKELLLAMPVAFAGPRLTELAKKSNDPNIRRNWVQWLEKYPDAYAQVLVAWLKLNQDDLPRVPSLLADYHKLRPEQAVYIWAQYIATRPLKELKSVYAFGLDKPQCGFQLAERALSSQDETTQLRLLRGIARCDNADSISQDQMDGFNKILMQYLNHTAPSRRIAALDAVGTVKPQDPEILARTAAIFKEAKNTTERAIALRSLTRIQPEAQTDAIRDALTGGDETLRLEAAALLAHQDGIALPQPEIQKAFAAETWPEIQMQLYQALSRRTPDHAELARLRKSILLDESRARALRSAVLEDILASAPESLTLADMETLIRQEAPLDLIAQTGESIYATTPSARPTLRTWLQAQQPFEHRMLSTFARFMHIDAKEKDASAIDFMRTICNSDEPRESTLQPCLMYFEANGQTEQDRELVEKLQRRQTQFDAMMNLDF